MDIEETLAKENCASEIECNKSPEGEPDKGVKPSTIVALEILKELKYNWFALVAYFQPEFSRQGYTQEDFDNFLVGFASQLHNLGLSDEELNLTEQSRVAYLNEMLAKE